MVVTPSAEVESTVGGWADISRDYVPELDVTWFFSPKVAVEAVVGTTAHTIHLNASKLGDLALGSVRIFSPSLIVQYHARPWSAVRPYVGVGAGYTLFYDIRIPVGRFDRVDYANASALGLQAGIDWTIHDGPLAANVDVKRVSLQTGASLDEGFITAEVSLHTWLLSIGIGYRIGTGAKEVP